MTTSNPSTRARGPYAKTAGIRANVVAIGIQLFSEVGYRGATMKAVAERAGMSLTGLLHHFSTKDDLLMAVLEERDRRAAAAQPLDQPHEIETRVLAILTENLAHPELVELHCVLSAEATWPDHPAHGYFRRRYAELRRQLTQEFNALVQAERLRSPLPPPQLATALLAYADGVQLQWLLDRDAVDLDDEIRSFLSALVVEV